jgi:hypothetical protein
VHYILYRFILPTVGWGYETITVTAGISPILLALPRHTLELFTGNMLGDGSVRYPNFSRDRKITSNSNARYSMSMAVAGFEYMKSLYDQTYGEFCSAYLRPYPNVLLPQHAGKEVTQYHFDTLLPIFSALHKL